MPRYLRQTAAVVLVFGIAAGPNPAASAARSFPPEPLQLPTASTPGEGPRTIDVAATADVVITGGRRGHLLGESVVDAGDVNGDGHRDVVVGAPGADPRGRRNAGAAYVIFGDGRERTGAPLRLNVRRLGDRGFRIIGEYGGGRRGADRIGTAHGLGDVNGDGLADVGVSAPSRDGVAKNSGRGYVVYGRRVGGVVDLRRLGRHGFRIEGTHRWAQTRIGSALGDVDRDGLADLLVLSDPRRSPDRLPSDYRTAALGFVVLGRRGDRDVDPAKLGDRGHAVVGTVPSLSAVARLGDVNGDGRPDLALGSISADYKTRRGDQEVGAVFVLLGRRPLQRRLDVDRLGQDGFRIDGDITARRNHATPGFGGVRRTGDVNGDGLDDLAITAFFRRAHGRHLAGRAYVVLGRESVRDIDLAEPSRRWFDVKGTGRSGDYLWSSRDVGDINGDGFDELAVRLLRDEGSVFYVGWGSPRPRPLDLRNFSRADGLIIGADAQPVSDLRKLAHRDGNRRASLLVGTPTAEYHGRRNAGKAWVLYR